jgi:hypothetical protein
MTDPRSPLGDRLGKLLQVEKFPPPAGFAGRAQVTYPAVYAQGEEGEERDLTYAELLNDVQQLAGALKAQGIGKGDVVGIYLPDDPRGGRGHARLRPHWRAAYRPLRRLRTRRGARAVGGLPGAVEAGCKAVIGQGPLPDLSLRAALGQAGPGRGGFRGAGVGG